jgi:hypothetical protein
MFQSPPGLKAGRNDAIVMCAGINAMFQSSPDPKVGRQASPSAG